MSGDPGKPAGQPCSPCHARTVVRRRRHGCAAMREGTAPRLRQRDGVVVQSRSRGREHLGLRYPVYLLPPQSLPTHLTFFFFLKALSRDRGRVVGDCSARARLDGWATGPESELVSSRIGRCVAREPRLELLHSCGSCRGGSQDMNLANLGRRASYRWFKYLPSFRLPGTPTFGEL